MSAEKGTTARSGIAVLALNATAVAFVAALAVQLFHEIVHGVTALLTGGEWVRFNLFAVDSTSPDATAETLVAGTAAIANIVCAVVLIAVLAKGGPGPLVRLFLTYLAAYSLFTGFGYLFIDALFRADQTTGDWARVLAALDAGWPVRLIVAAIGIGGVLFSFFWVPGALLRFVPDGPERTRVSVALHQVPYVVVCVVFTVLAIWHPVGAQGTVAVVLQYWLGSFALFWGGFMAAFWLSPKRTEVLPLPGRASTGWVAAAVLGLVAAALLAFA